MSEKSEKKAVVKADPVKTEAIKTAQAKSKSKSQTDRVEVEIKKDGSFYKKGDKTKVHPSVAEIFKEKGLI